jgi:hypothetical protein
MEALPDSNVRRHRCGTNTVGRRLSPMPAPEFDRDEVLVCMVLAFCIAAASVTTVYRVIG